MQCWPSGVLTACVSNPEKPPPGADLPFKQAPKNNDISLMSKEDLALLEESENPAYRFGSGDRLLLQVMGRNEVSGKHVIGPDGVITVPLIGDVFSTA
jgi:polysaccharide biosynthesis/export protein